jgi:MFS family permease
VAFAGPGDWPKLGIGIGLSAAALIAGWFVVYGGKGPAPEWRRNAVVGLLLACSGVIALWGIVFFSFDLIGSVLRKTFQTQGMAPELIDSAVGHWKGISSMMLNLGAFFGIYGFSVIGQRIGRKPAFAIVFVCAMISTAGVFIFFNTFSQIFWMLPIMGFFMLAVFGGYAVYFPELFPTHLRSTGISFCYNVGRFVAASGPVILGLLTSKVFHTTEEPMRWAGLSMCAIFLLGLCVLPFAPETKGRPLPGE